MVQRILILYEMNLYKIEGKLSVCMVRMNMKVSTNIMKFMALGISYEKQSNILQVSPWLLFHFP